MKQLRACWRLLRMLAHIAKGLWIVALRFPALSPDQQHAHVQVWSMQLLAQAGISMVPQGQLNIPEAEEPFATFIENALAKARHASQLSGLPALADDSGLCVRALDEAPGVYSARFAAREAELQGNLQTRDTELQRLRVAAASARERIDAVLARLPGAPSGEQH